MFGAVRALSAAPSLFRRGEGLPSGDDPGALERRSVAGQRREVAAHFSNGREFAIILQHSTNGIGCRLIYGEHVDSLRKRRARSKPYLMGRSGPGLPERCWPAFWSALRAVVWHCQREAALLALPEVSCRRGGTRRARCWPVWVATRIATPSSEAPTRESCSFLQPLAVRRRFRWR